MSRFANAGSQLSALYEPLSKSLVLVPFEQPGKTKTRSCVMTYQNALRTLGAWLDSNNASNVNLIETTTGYELRYGVGDDPLVLQRYILTHAELEHLESSMRERRSLNPNGRYQNLLRALGYEIDTYAGAFILLDEIGENYYLTFSFQRPDLGLAWLKRARVLDEQDQAAILRRAYARRKVPEPPKSRWHRLLRGQVQSEPMRTTR